MRADSRTQKLRALITTVDPSQRLIHAQTVDNSPISISVLEVDSGFTWPQEGEVWSVIKENTYWRLGGRLQGSEDPRRVEDLLPGQSLRPDYFEHRAPQGSTVQIISHNLGSKALSARVRPAFVGYTSTLSKDITAGLTSSLTTQESLPFGGNLRPASLTAWLMIDDEIIKFTSHTALETTGTYSTLSRGQLGTVAASHLSGAKVTLFAMAAGTAIPATEVVPIDNQRALVQFASPIGFPVDIALMG